MARRHRARHGCLLLDRRLPRRGRGHAPRTDRRDRQREQGGDRRAQLHDLDGRGYARQHRHRRLLRPLSHPLRAPDTLDLDRRRRLADQPHRARPGADRHPAHPHVGRLPGLPQLDHRAAPRDARRPDRPAAPRQRSLRVRTRHGRRHRPRAGDRSPVPREHFARFRRSGQPHRARRSGRVDHVPRGVQPAHARQEVRQDHGAGELRLRHPQRPRLLPRARRQVLHDGRQVHGPGLPAVHSHRLHAARAGSDRRLSVPHRHHHHGRRASGWPSSQDPSPTGWVD